MSYEHYQRYAVTCRCGTVIEYEEASRYGVQDAERRFRVMVAEHEKLGVLGDHYILRDGRS